MRLLTAFNQSRTIKGPCVEQVLTQHSMLYFLSWFAMFRYSGFASARRAGARPEVEEEGVRSAVRQALRQRQCMALARAQPRARPPAHRVCQHS